MPQPVQTIYSDNPGAIPAQYNLPASLDLDFASSRARFDGSGASGDFIMVLELLTSDGKLMLQARTDQEFAAGDTGVVSWAPFLRRAVSATPPPPSGATVQTLLADAASFAISAFFTTVVWTESGGFNDGTTLNINGSGNLVIGAAGTYRISVMSGGWTLANNKGTTCAWEVDVISGTEGQWSSKLPGFAKEAQPEIILRVDDPNVANLNVSQGLSPDLDAVAAWVTTDTFPVEIRFKIAKLEDGTLVAGSAHLLLSATRIGDTFE